ncbi:MAG: pyridoxal-phosphate dependent enzyme [Chitinophagaceae bacterium]|nr:pyridoxal-phosphate dependent enzyme [Chitinophagaceae bacterium]
MQLAFNDITTDLIQLPGIKDIGVFVLRLDKLHPVVSGNKWFKLRYYLADAAEQKKKRIVTFGGAWSNHIVATAAASKMYGFASAGIIRGEEPLSWSHTLLQAKEYGMELYFISREEYQHKKIPAGLLTDDNYYINEGGSGEKGVEGASSILDHTSKNFTHYCCAAGTGTMMAGLINAMLPGQKVTGISVMKNNFELEEQVRCLSKSTSREWNIIHDYHFGGYAKYKPDLFQFMNGFYRQTGVPSDFVYTGKLFFGVSDLLKNRFFPAGSRLLLIHSGGLQGNASLEKGTLIF